MDCDIITFFQEKLNNFCNYLYDISNNKDNAELIKNKTGNKWLDLFYLLRLSSGQKNNDVNDIMNKLEICEIHREKINEYYEMFLEIKDKYIKEM